ncbi:hypothetical protein [Amycolatopsis sp. NPDC059657]|uniref:hypothetical protein n=1 Tax=Amycolatopsis sp. NPDC059657 TaxID=3346899 RepID=UPI0036714122
MSKRVGLGVLVALLGVVFGPVTTASAAPIDDCRGLRLVCIFENPNHGGAVVWTAAENGSYQAPYRTRTRGSNLINSGSSWVRLTQASGGRSCQIGPGRDVDLPGYVNDNIGRIVVGSWTSRVTNC